MARPGPAPYQATAGDLCFYDARDTVVSTFKKPLEGLARQTRKWDLATQKNKQKALVLKMKRSNQIIYIETYICIDMCARI